MAQQNQFGIHPHLGEVLTRRQQVAANTPVKKATPQVAERARSGQNNRALADVQTIYAPGGPLFLEQCDDIDITSLSLAGSYHPILDVIGFEFSNVHHWSEKFLTYIGPDGTAAGSPTDGIMTGDACEPGFGSVEVGGTDLTVDGWTTIGRRGHTRDIVELHMKYCENEPQYRLDGSIITDDFEWDLVQMMAVMLQDLQRYWIIGNGAAPNQSDGLQETVRYGITDKNGDQTTALDSIVVDYNSNVMSSVSGATGVTVNGIALEDGWNLLDMIESFVWQAIRRIGMTPRLSGTPLMVGMTTIAGLSCLISAWVCRTVCGSSDLTVFQHNEDARMERERLLQAMANTGGITLPIVGVPITFMAYDYELLDPVTGNSDLYILTTRVGAQPVLRFHVKDMRQVVATENKMGPDKKFAYSEGGRVLMHVEKANYCETPYERMDFRFVNRAPWLQFRATGIACTTPFGHMSGDPLSPAFIEQNKVAGPFRTANPSTFAA